MATVIFDMDGTLIDSSKGICKTINYVRDKFGLEPIEDFKIIDCINRVDVNPSKELYDTESFTQEQRVLFEEYYHQICTVDMELYSGIFDLIHNLKSDNFKLAIATNASSFFAEKMLDSVNLKSKFDFIIGADKTKPKPQPDMLFEVMNSLNSNRNKSVIIGDSQKDYLSGINANIQPILVSWGFSKHDESDILVNNTDELYLKILEFLK